jgi:hypothetical protein
MATIKNLSINSALSIAKYDRHLTPAILKEYKIDIILHISGDSRDSHDIHRALGGMFHMILDIIAIVNTRGLTFQKIYRAQ